MHMSQSLFLFENCSTCLGFPYHPSSGAHIKFIKIVYSCNLWNLSNCSCVEYLIIIIIIIIKRYLKL
jgi:hypothetical protein